MQHITGDISQYSDDNRKNGLCVRLRAGVSCGAMLCCGLTEVISQCDGCVLLHAAILLLELTNHLHYTVLTVHVRVVAALTGLQGGGEYGDELVVGCD